MQKHALIVFLLIAFLSKASHNRSGEITYKRVAPFTKVVNGTVYQAYWYLITITKYTDDDTQPLGATSPNQVYDRCVDSVYFGDGKQAALDRINGGNPLCSGCKPCDCAHCGELIIEENGYRVKKNVYQVLHEYLNPGTYTIRTNDPNRNEGVYNIPYSDQQVFYLQSVLVIGNINGSNNSVQLTAPPIDKACLYKCFTHNPGAYDTDTLYHDSLSYKLTTPKGMNGAPISGYFNPPVPSGGVFKIDAHSGTLTWCSPMAVGEYNIAFIVEEWRKNTSNQYQLVGSVLRDMQVLVRTCASNDPPLVVVPNDTCVEAGTLITKKIRANDPNLGDHVTLSGFGGGFTTPAPKASMSQSGSNPVLATFNWQTSCEHIAQQPYQNTFKAEDDAGSNKLASYNTFNIRVLPPAVKDVAANPSGNSIQLSWSAAVCNPASNPLVNYKVYRREGCAPVVTDPCKSGIPDASGFVFIAQVNPSTLSFTDDNGGNGLIVGQNYGYLVIACYRDGVISFAGDQVCARLKRNVPVLYQVDVVATGVPGAVNVSWGRPLKTPGNLDTMATPGPYRFELRYRHDGIYSTVFTSTANYIYQLDTFYIHNTINTTQDSLEYSVDFYAGDNVFIGSSRKASSVFLSAEGSDRKVDLKWKSSTPWKNTKYTVYRKEQGSTVFNPLATTTLTTFSDKSAVANRHNYCYYVLAEGAYSDPTIFHPLLNRSQEVCVTPVDLTPPCTPTLDVETICPNGGITVKWNNVRPLCSDDVIRYLLFYKATVDEPYQKIFESDTTSFFYDGESPLFGCYAIQSKDSAGNLSALSPDFCADNCPEFELPNIFSPNKDGINDEFKAIKVQRIKEIELNIVDRWGVQVYTTRDPYFQWNGISIQSKQMVSEGTFFYVCTVYEPRVKGITKRVLKGYLQVVR